eukprot:756749-Hanusia_phi.AAC.12
MKLLQFREGARNRPCINSSNEISISSKNLNLFPLFDSFLGARFRIFKFGNFEKKPGGTCCNLQSISCNSTIISGSLTLQQRATAASSRAVPSGLVL